MRLSEGMRMCIQLDPCGRLHFLIWGLTKKIVTSCLPRLLYFHLTAANSALLKPLAHYRVGYLTVWFLFVTSSNGFAPQLFEFLCRLKRE
jgi:hypothetical protein